MGCVQSQPSSHPSKHHSSSVQARSSQHNPTSKRRSQEFYHQYQPAATPTQPHNYQKTNLSTTNSSSSVITGKENSRQRNVTKNHSKVKIMKNLPFIVENWKIAILLCRKINFLPIHIRSF